MAVIHSAPKIASSGRGVRNGARIRRGAAASASASIVVAGMGGSGIAGELRYAYLTRFRAGKLIYMKSYLDPADALRAAGLSE